MVGVSAVVGAIESVRILTASTSDLTGRYLADDAFYYFTLAEHFP